LTDADRLSDGGLVADHDAPVGGQAVLEGVMMRGVSTWAVAVRMPGGDVEVHAEPLVAWTRRAPVLRLPVIRGVVALVDSLNLGFRALALSADAQVPRDHEPIGRGMWAVTVAVALVLAIALFFLVPVGLTSLLRGALDSAVLFWLVESLVRTAIFLGYLVLLSRLRDLRRVLEYHGAEHKVISAYESGAPLTPQSAARFSRLHPRCGTSFLLVVMIVAIFVFAPVALPEWYLLLASRIVGVPLIVGLAFEIVRWAGRNRRRPWVRAVMWPGLQLQRLTTREPGRGQLQVAIVALEAVLEVERPGERSADDLVGLEVAA